LSDFRFAHIADAHVGAWPKNPALRLALRNSVLKALEAVEREKCDFLLVAGDLFHTPVPEPEEAAPLAKALRSLNEKGIPIYAIFGSHDFVLHHTSWLDVLSEGGLFQRIAPLPAIEENVRWKLPYLKDPKTGAFLAGLSGRAQGLDRKLYETMDATGFAGEQGFKIFMFHAGILEYLPAGLAGRVEGLPLEKLPAGCDYYAGGHIHATYLGSGPGGHGLLVNPGAVFGTSVTDLESISSGVTQAGLVIVDVKDGFPTPRWVITTDKNLVRVVDVNLDGADAAEAIKRLHSSFPQGVPGGALIVPRLRGSPARQLDLTALSEELKGMGAGTVAPDTENLASVGEAGEKRPELPPEEIEVAVLREALAKTSAIPGLEGEDGLKVAGQLLRTLGVPQAKGESREDYRKRMVGQALKALGVETGEVAGQ
jgi:hypothetical protein